jgi:hypothetical protein
MSIVSLSKLERGLIPNMLFSYCPENTSKPTDCFQFDLAIAAIPGRIDPLIPGLEEITPEMLENVELLQGKFLKPEEKLSDIEWGDKRFTMLDILSSIFKIN